MTMTNTWHLNYRLAELATAYDLGFWSRAWDCLRAIRDELGNTDLSMLDARNLADEVA